MAASIKYKQNMLVSLIMSPGKKNKK